MVTIVVDASGPTSTLTQTHTWARQIQPFIRV